jgi:hypothetical protein
VVRRRQSNRLTLLLVGARRIPDSTIARQDNWPQLSDRDRLEAD